jgi:hypothetical protein
MRELHFHHVDRKSKVKEISDMVRESGNTLDNLKNEINKCKIVCQKCHINIHSRTRDECINALEYVAEKLGKSPTFTEYNECRRDTDPSSSSIIRCFDSWNDAKETANLTTNINTNSIGYTRDDCIDSLEYVSEKLGKSPTFTEYRDYKSDTDPSPSTMYNIFGSWNDAKEAANLTTNINTNSIGYTRDDCIDSLEYVSEKLNKSPTRSEYNECRRYTDPSSSSIARCFDSWNDAKESADLKTVSEDINKRDTCLEPESDAGLVIEGQSKLGNF